MVDKIDVTGDPRVKWCSTVLNGTTYGYILGVPASGEYRATIFLIHGFPDLAMGWRYQIPILLNMGLRVVAPDCIGYGKTDSPEFSDDTAPKYSPKQCGADMKELARQLGSEQIILGGHDWGGFIVFRIALHYPDFVTHLFSVCTPYGPPSPEFMSLERIWELAPFTHYQKQFVSGELEKTLTTKEKLKQFLIAAYGGRTENGETGFDTSHGVYLDRLPDLKPSPLLDEKELDYYAEEFARHGLQGPLSYYRNRLRIQNYNDELPLVGKRLDHIPLLFIRTMRDNAIPPEITGSMGHFFEQLTVKEVEAAHWALWQKPEECNAAIADWLSSVVFNEEGSKL